MCYHHRPFLSTHRLLCPPSAVVLIILVSSSIVSAPFPESVSKYCQLFTAWCSLRSTCLPLYPQLPPPLPGLGLPPLPISPTVRWGLVLELLAPLPLSSPRRENSPRPGLCSRWWWVVLASGPVPAAPWAPVRDCVASIQGKQKL